MFATVRKSETKRKKKKGGGDYYSFIGNNENTPRWADRATKAATLGKRKRHLTVSQKILHKQISRKTFILKNVGWKKVTGNKLPPVPLWFILACWALMLINLEIIMHYTDQYGSLDWMHTLTLFARSSEALCLNINKYDVFLCVCVSSLMNELPNQLLPTSVPLAIRSESRTLPDSSLCAHSLLKALQSAASNRLPVCCAAQTLCICSSNSERRPVTVQRTAVLWGEAWEWTGACRKVPNEQIMVT